MCNNVNLKINECVVNLKETYNVLDTFDLNEYANTLNLLQLNIRQNYKEYFEPNERIVFYYNEDFYNNKQYGTLLKSLQVIINEIDISNFFIIVVTTNKSIDSEYLHILKNYSNDAVPFELYCCAGPFKRSDDKLDAEISKHNVIKEKNYSSYSANLLDKNKSFCVMPWIQTHVSTKGKVYPCCTFNDKLPLGDSKDNSLAEIFNNDNSRKLRLDMLEGKKINGCELCIKNEHSSKPSYRKVANNRFLSHVNKTKNTKINGSYPYKHIAWDIRFDNLCNLKCRTCGYSASTSWFSDAVKLGLNPSKHLQQPSEIFDQFLQHVDHVEQIYFAGGEPLIIEKCWDILDKLIEYNKLDVELVYNTNFTKLDFKGKSIFAYLKKFKQVHIGASLDAMGRRAEYWRHGTIWNNIESNRQRMLFEAPDMGFSIDATVSLVNALHVMDFHKDWVNKKLIRADQFTPKVLDIPNELALHHAPKVLKEKIRNKVNQHIEWLTPLDRFEKSLSGFKAIQDALKVDIEFNAEKFWKTINDVDEIRNENLLDVFPELQCLEKFKNV